MSDYYFDDLEPFHPAQHFTEDTAYIGVCLESEVPISKGPNKGETRRQPVLAFVTSDREVVPASYDILRSRGLRYSSETFPAPPEARFRPSAIKRFIEGELKRPNVPQLYGSIREAFAVRSEYPDEAVADVIALFVFGTYVYRLFDTFPYVVFRGSKETGKSKSLKLIGALAFNAIG